METTTAAKPTKRERNPRLTEPTSFTKCGIWNMHKPAIRTWATEHCLLEHLSSDEVAVLTKGQLVDEIMAALLRLEVDEDRRALATDTVARPLAELLS